VPTRVKTHAASSHAFDATNPHHTRSGATTAQTNAPKKPTAARRRTKAHTSGKAVTACIADIPVKNAVPTINSCAKTTMRMTARLRALRESESQAHALVLSSN
jgi:hypothetical protein